MKKIIVIVGPTGVGKTKLSIELAKKLNGEIINADSTQIFKEANIGTAKVTKNEMEGIKHHLIDIKELNDDYTVYDYQIDGRKTINKLLKENKPPIVVGGSGLYLSALLYDYKFCKENNVYDFDSLSNKEMFEALKNFNLNIDKNNRQRLIRAYAKYIYNSEPIENTGGDKLIYDVEIIGLTTEREILYKKINKRVDKMIEDGLIDEARKLHQKYPNSKQLRSIIGYKEFLEYFEEKAELDEVISSIKQASRNYAKRQYTWFNYKLNIKWYTVNYNNFDETTKEVMLFIDKKQG